MEHPPAAVSKWIVAISVMIPTMIEILDMSVANVALSHIQGSLSASQEEVTWVLTSYLVANAVIIPMSGWLATVFGRKKYLLLSLTLFTLSSLLCGLTNSFALLIVFRVLQGIGGGALQPISQAILLETFPPRQRGLAMAIYAMGAVSGPILGPLLGGYLTDNFSWRWIFYINLPIGLLAFYMNYTFISDPPYQQRFHQGEKIDYLGICLLTVGLGSLQIVLDKGQQDDWFSSTFIVVLSAVAVFCLLNLIVRCLTIDHPIVDLRLFKDMSFAIGNFVMFLGFFAFFGSIVLLPIFLQKLMGYPAFLAGLVLGPGALISLMILPLVGKLTERVDSRILLSFGLIVNAYALYYMAGFTLGIDFGTSIHSRLIQSLGLSFFFAPLSYLTLARVQREQMNNASALFNLVRNLGGSAGVAFVTTLLARRTQFHQSRLIENLSLYDVSVQQAIAGAREYLATCAGMPDAEQLAALRIYYGLQRQAAAMAFSDAFYLQALLFVLLIAMVWIMKKPPVGKRR